MTPPNALSAGSRRDLRANSRRWPRAPTPGCAWPGGQRYEALDDLLGRRDSYAGLLDAGNTTDPAWAKFDGDMQERITAASLHLLFFTLELNRIDDAAIDAAMADPALGHYRPWIEDVRKEKPHQLEDRVEDCSTKSVTGGGGLEAPLTTRPSPACVQGRGQAALDRGR